MDDDDYLNVKSPDNNRLEKDQMLQHTLSLFFRLFLFSRPLVVPHVGRLLLWQDTGY
eukprot:gene8977-6300_t